MAETLHQQSANERAEEYFKQARELASKSGDPLKFGDICAESAQNRAADDLGAAVNLYDDAIAQYKKLDEKPAAKLAGAYIGSAELRDKMGQLADANQRAQQASTWSSRMAAADSNDINQRISAAMQTPFAPSVVPTAAAPSSADTVGSQDLQRRQIELGEQQLKLQEKQHQDAENFARSFAERQNQNYSMMVPQLQNLRPAFSNSLQQSSPYQATTYPTISGNQTIKTYDDGYATTRASGSPAPTSSQPMLGIHGVPVDQIRR
jgi:hypothetical protein